MRYPTATGRRPFDGQDVMAVLHQLATHTRPPADAVNLNVPPAVTAPARADGKLIDFAVRRCYRSTVERLVHESRTDLAEEFLRWDGWGRVPGRQGRR